MVPPTRTSPPAEPALRRRPRGRARPGRWTRPRVGAAAVVLVLLTVAGLVVLTARTPGDPAAGSTGVRARDAGSVPPTTREVPSTEPAPEQAPEPEAAPPGLRIEDVSAPEQVDPPSGSPLHGVRRDCPLSVPLSDGRSLWIFCDTSDFSPTGALRSFTNTTATIVDAGTPAAVDDATDGHGRPIRFLTPTAGYQPCTASQTRLVWPHSAVAVPQPDGTDRVLIWFQSVCSSPGVGLTGDLFRDVGLAEYRYDPAHPPAPGTGITGRIVREQLFTRPPYEIETYGSGAVYDGTDVYVYRCSRSARCTVGRTAPATADDPAAYRWWDGHGWVEDPGAAAPMTMTGAPDTFAMKPSVRYVPALGLYVLADAVEFGSGSMRLRLARAPQGPWGPAVTFRPPDCTYGYPRQCIGAEVHPQWSDATTLAVSYYNPGTTLGASPVRLVRVRVTIGR